MGHSKRNSLVWSHHFDQVIGTAKQGKGNVQNFNGRCLYIYKGHGLVKMEEQKNIQSRIRREFPGGPVVRTQRFDCQGPGFNPWSGN